MDAGALSVQIEGCPNKVSSNNVRPNTVRPKCFRLIQYIVPHQGISVMTSIAPLGPMDTMDPMNPIDTMYTMDTMDPNGTMGPLGPMDTMETMDNQKSNIIPSRITLRLYILAFGNFSSPISSLDIQWTSIGHILDIHWTFGRKLLFWLSIALADCVDCVHIVHWAQWTHCVHWIHWAQWTTFAELHNTIW